MFGAGIVQEANKRDRGNLYTKAEGKNDDSIIDIGKEIGD